MRLSATMLVAGVFLLLTAVGLRAQAGFDLAGDGLAPARHTQVSLLLPVTSARAGDTVLAGVRMVMQPGWHTYWKNPGEAGEATQIQWQLPAGVTADPIEWPLPEKLPPIEVTTFGYQGEVVLLVPLHLATNLPAGPVNLSAKVTWLECKDSCIPQKEEIGATLMVGPVSEPSGEAETIAKWKGQLPDPDRIFSFTSWWSAPANGSLRTLVMAGVQMGSDTVPVESVDFFPANSDTFEVQPETVPVPMVNGFGIRKVVKKYSGDWPATLSGLVVIEGNHQRWGFEVALPIASQMPAGFGGAAGTASSAVTAAASPPITPEKPLLVILLYAFIGGLILNIMPCVLPVIALKILGFVSEAQSQPARVRALGGIYAVGVLMSFLTLALLVITLKSAGRLVGWGVQFSSPAFVVSLTVLVTLVALNLFGLFEVILGGKATDIAGNLSSRRGAGGAFFNGVLATALATPCTAPFLGYALGFAFAQPPAMILLIFLTAGLGLAAPYLVLSWNPGWLKFLPKPGAWMEKFKIAMGFPVLASALWLFTLAAGSLNKDGVLRFGLFLVALAFAAWIWGEFVQRGSRRRAVAGFLSVALVAGAGAYAYHASPDELTWQPWSEAAVAQARAAGKPVLVDFTADWCLTCQVNKKTSLEIPSVRAKLKELGAVALVGDYTHSPDDITRELAKYHRAGVPLVLCFPAQADREAIVLPEILTPGIVLDALNQVAK